MQVKIFTISVFNYEQNEKELNKFLSSHKVLQIDKEFYSNANEGYWCFIIKYLETGMLPSFEQKKKEKVDYKTVLSPVQFEIFSNLREKRKEIAKEEGIPAYAVFTDEEIGNIAQLGDLTESKIKGIKGIGSKKCEKYGKKIIKDLIVNEKSK